MAATSIGAQSLANRWMHVHGVAHEISPRQEREDADARPKQPVARARLADLDECQRGAEDVIDHP